MYVLGVDIGTSSSKGVLVAPRRHGAAVGGTRAHGGPAGAGTVRDGRPPLVAGVRRAGP
ncbi:hypothetical protein ACFSTC_21805 [Nonomuraea ferruginea]